MKKLSTQEPVYTTVEYDIAFRSTDTESIAEIEELFVNYLSEVFDISEEDDPGDNLAFNGWTKEENKDGETIAHYYFDEECEMEEYDEIRDHGYYQIISGGPMRYFTLDKICEALADFKVRVPEFEPTVLTIIENGHKTRHNFEYLSSTWQSALKKAETCKNEGTISCRTLATYSYETKEITIPDTIRQLDEKNNDILDEL